MESPLSFTIDLAQRAGEVLLGYFSPNGMAASLKADRTLVTEADLAADQLIAAAIHQSFPGEALLSEELQQQLEELTPAVWVVDPLDGTSNFSLGFPIWGVSIARLIDGWPALAVVYFPALKELYAAERGGGATLNGERLLTPPPDPNKPAAFFACCSRTYRRYEVGLRYKTRILGSACYSLCAVARGMALVGFEVTPKVWDLAAAWLIVQEAGGSIVTHDGSQPFPLMAGFDYRRRDFPTLAAATVELAGRAKEQIKPKGG